jgi:membrane-bound hydrogenase subunit beta
MKGGSAMKRLKAEEFVQHVREHIGDKLLDSQIKLKKAGLAQLEYEVVWLTVDREAVVDTVKAMKKLDYPMLSVMSGYDAGDHLVILYHMALYRTVKNATLHVELVVKAPKDDLWIPTITTEIPGAAVTEQEKREMLGIEVRGLEDMNNVFLPTDFPKDIYPWRKDETGVDAKMPKRAGGED